MLLLGDTPLMMVDYTLNQQIKELVLHKHGVIWIVFTNIYDTSILFYWPQHYTTGWAGVGDHGGTWSTWRRRGTSQFHWLDEWRWVPLARIGQTLLPKQPDGKEQCKWIENSHTNNLQRRKDSYQMITNLRKYFNLKIMTYRATQSAMITWAYFIQVSALVSNTIVARR